MVVGFASEVASSAVAMSLPPLVVVVECSRRSHVLVGSVGQAQHPAAAEVEHSGLVRTVVCSLVEAVVVECRVWVLGRRRRQAVRQDRPVSRFGSSLRYSQVQLQTVLPSVV